MKFFCILIFNLSIVSLSISQTNNPTGAVTNSGTSGNSGTTGTSTGNTGANNGDGTQGYNQGYSYNTGIQPFQQGFTYYQPFGDNANQQNTNSGNTANSGQTPNQQPVAVVGYQPGFNVFTNGQPVQQQNGQPVLYQNVPALVHFGQPPPQQGARPVPVPVQIQPIQLPNFDAGGLNLDSFGLGDTPIATPPVRQNQRRNHRNNNQIPNLGAFGADFLGGNNNNNNNNNDFVVFPTSDSNQNNNNGYDGLPDDQSLANFANLGGGGGGGQSNDYNDFGGLGDFGSATQNRGTFDILPNFQNGFFRRK